jgi:hypothetical protein
MMKKHFFDSITWSEPAFRVFLAVVRFFLCFCMDRKQSGPTHFQQFFAISLPASLAFFTVMIGDILAFQRSKLHLGEDAVNRSAMVLLRGYEIWQMVSIFVLEESFTILHLIICIAVVIIIRFVPEDVCQPSLFAAFMCVTVVCCDVLSFNHRHSGFMVVFAVLLTVASIIMNSYCLRYCIHFCLIFNEFRRQDCLMSGMITMIAVSQFGVNIAQSVDKSKGHAK